MKINKLTEIEYRSIEHIGVNVNTDEEADALTKKIMWILLNNTDIKITKEYMEIKPIDYDDDCTTLDDIPEKI